MLGIIRFFLASCVILFHLTAKIPVLGNFAVNFFYVISGYLITLILNKTYYFDFKRFFLNRFLRLYPVYFFFLIFGSTIIFLAPATKQFHQSWTSVFQPGDVWGNLFIFPWAFLSDHAVFNPFALFTNNYPGDFDGTRFRIITSSWSVAVELICYALLWFYTARGWRQSVIAIVVAGIYHLYALKLFTTLEIIYFPFLAAMLPFSIGTFGFFAVEFLKEKGYLLSFSEITQISLCFIAIGLFLLNWYVYCLIQPARGHLFFYYLNNVIAIVIVILFANSTLTGKIAHWAKWLGDLSYPMFLCQYFAGYFAWLIVGSGFAPRGWNIFFIGYPIAIVLAFISVVLIDKKLYVLRNRIREGYQIKRLGLVFSD
ncbi:MAG: acyltransferase [Legionella sp.]|uniref:acyltransferase family protein n=1 Tax=Legionella sp. TaxID=459 RepID=UPI0039E71663